MVVGVVGVGVRGFQWGKYLCFMQFEVRRECGGREKPEGVNEVDEDGVTRKEVDGGGGVSVVWWGGEGG